jgi:hypothetical protein
MHDLSDSSAAPAAFGPFRVLHQIGIGVLGPVYRAQDSVRDQLVAVKAFKLDAPPEQAEDIADALRDVAHALPRHRGLIEYIAAGVERSTPYLVMSHSDVVSLDVRLKPGVPMDAEETLDLIATLADAIDAAHSRGIIHGTLHPRDVFVDDRGGCRVSGFGVATALAGAGVRAVPVRRPYSPPERVVGGAIERSADLFALGALAFELFSGRRVVGTGLDAAVRCTVSAPDVDLEHLRTALAAMLAENPIHRPSSATAFAQAVTQAVHPRGVNPATMRRRATTTSTEIKPGAGTAATSVAGAANRAGAGAAAATGAGAAGAAAASGAGAGSGGAEAGAVATGGGAAGAGRHDGSAAEAAGLGIGLGAAAARAFEPGASDAPDAADAASVNPDGSGSGGAGEQDGPPADALELFTRQGTLWEANRNPEGDGLRLETVTVSPDEDPLAQFASEAATPRETSVAYAAAASHADEAREIHDAALPHADSRGAAADIASTGHPEPLATTIDDESTPDDVQSIADAARTWQATRAAAQPRSSRAVGHAHDHDDDHDHAHDHDLAYVAAGAHATSGDAHADAVTDPDAVMASTGSGATSGADDHDHVLTGLRSWTPAEEPAESGSNFLRVTMLVLGVGLAVGVAGGYLLGQRSALRQAFALLRGEHVTSDSDQAASSPASTSATPAASSANPTPSTAAGSAAQSSPTIVSEPTPIPEGSTRPETPHASRTPSSPATPSASPSPAAAKPPAATPSAATSARDARASAGAAARGSAPAAAASAPAASSAASRNADRVPSRSAATARASTAPATVGRLLVRSSPARAEVTVNGVRRGETPMTVRDLPFGTHTIRVSRSGYQPSTRRITLSASRATDAVAFDLDPEPRPSRAAARESAGGAAAFSGDPDVERASAEAAAAGLGALYILSHPTGARVIIDGTFVGSTPLLVTNVPPGAKTVRLELPGHKTWSSSVRVGAGQRVRVAASLEEGTN